MLAITSSNNHLGGGVKRYLTDHVADLRDFENETVGTMVFVIETGETFILTGQRVWSKQSGPRDGVNGAPGRDGKSAYEIAVEEGFVGTKTEWLNSLKISNNELNELINAAIDKRLFGGKTATVSSVEDFTKVLNNDETEVKITLSDNLEIEDALVIPTGKEVTLVLNNNVIETSNNAIDISGNLTIQGGAITGTYKPLIVRSNGQLTIDGTDITSTNDCAVNVVGENASVIVEDGDITAQEVPVLVTSGGAATINGGHLKGIDNFAIGGNGTPGKGNINVTINGGIIEGQIVSNGYTAAAIYWPNSGTLNINGGTIISTGAGIVQRGGTVNLNEGTVVQAQGPAGFVGKVGDSRIVVGSYAVVFDKNSRYPDMDNMVLNIAEDVELEGTDGDLQVLPADATGINDLRF